jgi:hypothetical protein
MMNWLAFQLPRQMSLDSPSGRGSETVITGGIKENECDRIGLIALNKKWGNNKKKEMSRGIGCSEGTAQNENRRRAR